MEMTGKNNQQVQILAPPSGASPGNLCILVPKSTGDNYKLDEASEMLFASS